MTKPFNQVEYKNQFNAQKYDRITIMTPKGQKEVIRAHAESRGESVNAFIQRAIAEAMKRDEDSGKQ